MISPQAYLITFTCYGTWLHGIKKTSVDRSHKIFDSEFVIRNALREKYILSQIKQKPYVLDYPRRTIVLNTIKEVCTFHAWKLLAVHVRTNHVHVVIVANIKVEKILNTLKIYSSRALNKSSPNESNLKKWTRHGSTRYLWNDKNVTQAIWYVIFEQGLIMQNYLDKNYNFELL